MGRNKRNDQTSSDSDDSSEDSSGGKQENSSPEDYRKLRSRFSRKNREIFENDSETSEDIIDVSSTNSSDEVKKKKALRGPKSKRMQDNNEERKRKNKYTRKNKTKLCISSSSDEEKENITKPHHSNKKVNLLNSSKNKSQEVIEIKTDTSSNDEGSNHSNSLKQELQDNSRDGFKNEENEADRNFPKIVENENAKTIAKEGSLDVLMEEKINSAKNELQLISGELISRNDINSFHNKENEKKIELQKGIENLELQKEKGMETSKMCSSSEESEETNKKKSKINSSLEEDEVVPDSFEMPNKECVDDSFTTDKETTKMKNHSKSHPDSDKMEKNIEELNKSVSFDDKLEQNSHSDNKKLENLEEEKKNSVQVRKRRVNSSNSVSSSEDEEKSKRKSKTKQKENKSNQKKTDTESEEEKIKNKSKSRQLHIRRKNKSNPVKSDSESDNSSKEIERKTKRNEKRKHKINSSDTSSEDEKERKIERNKETTTFKRKVKRNGNTKKSTHKDQSSSSEEDETTENSKTEENKKIKTKNEIKLEKNNSSDSEELMEGKQKNPENPKKLFDEECISISDSSSEENVKKKPIYLTLRKDLFEQKPKEELNTSSKNTENDLQSNEEIISLELDSDKICTRSTRKNNKTKKEIEIRASRKRKLKIIDSDTDSDVGSKKKHQEDFQPTSSSESESESEEEKVKKNTSKRRRIKRLKDSSSDSDANEKVTRKQIRKVLTKNSLEETTIAAEKAEKERKARIMERQKKYNQIFDADKLERATVEKIVLDFNDETKEELLSVNETLAKKLKPHQASGVKFMWDSCFESLERIKKTKGSGCILAHCMGLGKTLQVITFVHTLLNNSEKTLVNKVLIVCPLTTVLNWVAEFENWLSDVDGEIDIYEIVKCRNNIERQCAIRNWSEGGGVMVIGYNMFRLLTNDTNKRVPKKIRELYKSAFLDPGPDLVVCDEGHLLKNEKTNLSIAMNKIVTPKRIVLTGTPMQNNLREYYCMVQFIKPNLLGTYKEYLNRFVNPITNGQYIDSTPHDIAIMKRRSHVLHSLLDGVIQRRDYSVLAPFLPPKYEYVLFITLSEVQIKLYEYYLNNLSRQSGSAGQKSGAFLFQDFQELQRICSHPRVLLDKSIEEKNKRDLLDEDSEGSLKDFIDDDEEEASSSSNSDSDKSSNSSSQSETDTKRKPRKRVTRGAVAAGIVELSDNEEVTGTKEWWSNIVSEKDLNKIELSSKLFLLFTILQQCEQIGDKVLIFSQSLYSLNVIEYFLNQVDEATQKGESEDICGLNFSGCWCLGLDYFRIDGSSSCDNRQAWCNSFNDPENVRARLFLISTRAGGLGINLVAANRVIIFDVSWNPSHDIQSIYRVYRFGQTKPCYIYRFVTYGTMEMKIYERQVTKQAISKRVVDEQQIDRHYNQNDLAELYKFEAKPSRERPIPLVPKDILLGELLQSQANIIYSYHEHQSLLENKEEEELNEEERKAAWEEFENEKTLRKTVNNPFNSASQIPIANIVLGAKLVIKRDNPTWTEQQIQSIIPAVMQQLQEQMMTGNPTMFNRIAEELRLFQIRRQQHQQMRMQQLYMQQHAMQNLSNRPIGMPVDPWEGQLASMLNLPNLMNNANVTPEIIELND